MSVPVSIPAWTTFGAGCPSGTQATNASHPLKRTRSNRRRRRLRNSRLRSSAAAPFPIHRLFRGSIPRRRLIRDAAVRRCGRLIGEIEIRIGRLGWRGRMMTALLLLKGAGNLGGALLGPVGTYPPPAMKIIQDQEKHQPSVGEIVPQAEARGAGGLLVNQQHHGADKPK